MQALPRAILFDLDDTIISAYGRPERAWRTVVAEFSSQLAPLSEDVVVDAIRKAGIEFWSDPERHRIWRQRPKDARYKVVTLGFAALEQAGHHVPSIDVQRAIGERFAALREEQMHLFPDAHNVLDELRSQGVKLALITNGDGPSQRAKVVRFELADRFDHIQIEGEHGIGKPEPQAYVDAMRSLGVEAEDTWMVGDNLDWEVVAPQQLGIYAIWYDPYRKGVPDGHTAKPDRIIHELSALRACE
ncbi:HAD family hydrolase [Antrihabitans cavernicola]|uniref:HAD family hydrolase n=1 Tax=Antrihabitans cavernicola TaxID=2495913 RepID=A0A5A7SFU2_9NOCA|nr:HAD family hydrolase [Spelaeibacter cavernicola]KAA0024686.1 HAD family hydrolase [Spelaeibacter cavernicola]